MMRKLVIIGALGLVLAVSACRNPDDREPEARHVAAGGAQAATSQ